MASYPHCSLQFRSTVRERADMRSVLFAPLSDAAGFLVWTLESTGRMTTPLEWIPLMGFVGR